MNDQQNCPHCGADADDDSLFLCGTEEVLVGVFGRASGCYERQLAAKDEEIDALNTKIVLLEDEVKRLRGEK
jgi:hypothetical protein